MPTAGRLAGAIMFALYGWYVAGYSVRFFPEENAPDLLIPVATFVGLLIGWMIVGSRAGRGYNPAIGIGLTAASAYSFWVIFLLSFQAMMKNAMRRLYDGPMEALADTFDIMLEQAKDFLDIGLIITVFVGGIICAWVTEYFGKRYP